MRNITNFAGTGALVGAGLIVVLAVFWPAVLWPPLPAGVGWAARALVYIYVYNGVLAFLLFGYDKRLSQQTGQWRVPEATLHGLEALGGLFGAGIGMVVWRHKWRKRPYVLVTAGIAALHVLVWIVLIGLG